jgi:amino acid permease
MAAGPETASGVPAGRPGARIIAAVVLVVLAVLMIVLGVIYLVEPSQSLPSFLPGHVPGSTRHHMLRTAGSFVLALMFLAGAWIALTFQPKTAASTR